MSIELCPATAVNQNACPCRDCMKAVDPWQTLATNFDGVLELIAMTTAGLEETIEHIEALRWAGRSPDPHIIFPLHRIRQELIRMLSFDRIASGRSTEGTARYHWEHAIAEVLDHRDIHPRDPYAEDLWQRAFGMHEQGGKR